MRIPNRWAEVLSEADQRGWSLDSLDDHLAGESDGLLHLKGCSLAGLSPAPVDLSRLLVTRHSDRHCDCWARIPRSMLSELEAVEALLRSAGALGEVGDELIAVLEDLDGSALPTPRGVRTWSLLLRAEQQLRVVRSLATAGDLHTAASELVSEVAPMALELRALCEAAGPAKLIRQALACEDDPRLYLVDHGRTGQALAAAWGCGIPVGQMFLVSSPGQPQVRHVEIDTVVPLELEPVAQTAAALHAGAGPGDLLSDPAEAVRAALLLG